jgi:arylsulfatase A-like enzyme
MLDHPADEAARDDGQMTERPEGAFSRRVALKTGVAVAALGLGPAALGLDPASLVSAAAAQVAPGVKPNVVFILADNVGYGDLGCYGGGELRGAPTPNLDQMAREGLRLTQYLVEPACTPSRAALMTGQYSIRNGLSLIAVEGSPNTLSASAYTMGQMFKGVGYATAIFGKWHLGSEPQSLPTAHGFDEFYGIPPNLSWDSCTYVDTMVLTHSSEASLDILLAKGPQIYEGKANEPLRAVKPFTEEVRANIDIELVAKSIDFMRRQKDAGNPFFLYLPFSMGHFPNLPSPEFKGRSRIGDYGDKLMEGDHHVGQILQTLKELGVDDDTIVVFASDNGPQGEPSENLAIRVRRTWAIPVHFAANWAKRQRGLFGRAPLSDGPPESTRTLLHTRCSRLWISCPPSRKLSAARCQRTGPSTAWTSPRSLPEPARRGIARIS